MIELERTSDPVRLSILRSILTDADIEHYVFDTGAGNLWQGAIPQRLMVRDEDIELARRAIAEAGL
jgi:Putative prokaryotic signal transducing protein